jgi:hypothetical protein
LTTAVLYAITYIYNSTSPVFQSVRRVRIQFFSDLHVDVAPIKPIVVRNDVDVVAVAGDVCQGTRNAFIALRRIVPERIPVVAIAGNHEFYRRAITDEIAAARENAAEFNIRFAENDVVVVGNGSVRFVACVLWTDYRVFGAASAGAAMEAARTGLNDHRVISWQKQPWSRFRPQEALLLHERSIRFLEDTLSAPFDGTTVVMTHHAPHFGSVDERFSNDLLTAAYVSDLSRFMTAPSDCEKSGKQLSKIAIWNHGHMHSSSDYLVNGTRVLANPHGYGVENPRFDPQLVVELGR